MDSGKTKTKYEELGLSQKIIISNEIYTFKKELINDFISYRCIHRNCKASIKISLEVAKKINNKEENNNIVEYTLIGILKDGKVFYGEYTIVGSSGEIKLSKYMI